MTRDEAAPTRGGPVSGWVATRVLARLTLRRLTRGRTFWVSVVLLALPLFFAALLGRKDLDAVEHFHRVFGIAMLLLAIVPPLHLAAVLGEEVDDKTFTYLWSRPVPRWSVVLGKTLALVPVLVLAFGLSVAACYVASMQGGPGEHVDALGRALAGIAVGVFGASMTSVGFGSLLPRFPVPITIAYIFVFDVPVGALPIKIKYLSFTYHTRVIAGETADDVVMSVVWALVIAAAWLGVALWRVSRAEYRGDT